MQMSQAHAERGWEYFTSRGVLARDLSLNLPGLERVIRTQIEAGLLPPQTAVATSPYIEPGYLTRAGSSAH
jgi:hypothetical protein